jgi:amino acid adenylation domain-containing protein
LNGANAVSLFAHTAAIHPDRPAVSDQERTLTYRGLDERSDALAARLRAEGVHRGDRVAVYLDRGVDVLVAVLGILKAGAGYVAVDPRYPDARRDLMIVRSGARIVLTGEGWRDRVEAVGTTVVEFATARVPAAPVGFAAEPCTGADEACVLFTSGSSGAPKAIVLEHANLRYLATNPALPAFGPGDRIGQVSSISFDAFHIEVWCAFAGGAEVVVLPTMPDLIALDLGRELRRRRITAMLAPTMAVNHVVHEDRDAFAALRVLYTGGDVLQPAAARRLLTGAFGGQFHNLYGPSEATTACTAHHVTLDSAAFETVPIGTALDGARLYLLDADLDPVPDGTVAELYIGGAGVARGYLGQAALTADRFRPDPFGAPGSRMYATGDRAVRNPGGCLEFRGRTDEQVKIRGYRVEPKEAERAVLRHPAVRDAAVVVAGEVHDRRLVAVVVLDEAVPLGDLRAYAAEVLPDYLVPASFIPVAEIPGTDHGKRDADRLRTIAADDLARHRDRVAPRDQTEAYLAEIWGRLLSVDAIGATDDFFALGGNSMLGFRMQRRIRRDLGVAVDVREILENSELAALADLVRGRQAAGARS